MKKSSQNNIQKIKIILIVISIAIVLFSLNGYMITSKEGGAIPLTLFESFYVYLLTVSFAIYLIIKNKKSNGMIFLSILTYIWTYLIIRQMIKQFNDVNINIEPLFYVYLSSAIFLVISLFLNEKNNKEKNINLENINSNIKNTLSKDNFLFANFILGIKEIPLMQEILLVNNVQDNSLDLIYMINNNRQTMKISINCIKNISFKTSMKMQNMTKKVESNETRNMLLSAVMFGGNPLLQLIGNSAFNSLFEGISNNYDKVNFSAYFEINITAFVNDQEIKLLMNTTSNPKAFIDYLKGNTSL